VEIRQLRYFCAVAETGSFTRGAHQQRITQPTLSQQLIKLENELGTRLFDRLGRRIKLTTAGTKFLPAAIEILSKISAAKAQSYVAGAGPADAVRVGAIPTVVPYFLSPALSLFRRQYPTVEIRVVEKVQGDLVPSLREAKLDLAVVQWPVPGAEFVGEELFREPLYMAVPNEHVLAGKRTARLGEFRKDAFLMLHEDFHFSETVREVMRKAQIRPNIVFESLSFEGILAMVSAGVGVAVLPAMATRKKRGCSFMSLRGQRETHRIGWLTLRRATPSPAQDSFVEVLRHATRYLERTSAPGTEHRD
jgi:LysR family transcriptional regulator, hydrogen peroxide-inducible genes activator